MSCFAGVAFFYCDSVFSAVVEEPPGNLNNLFELPVGVGNLLGLSGIWPVNKLI